MSHAQATPLPQSDPLTADCRREADTADFVAVADSAQYRELRSRFVNFAFSMTIAALIAYFTYVVLSIYAVDFMSQPFLSLRGTNLGIVIGLTQFVIVWVWTAIYVRWTSRRIDPTADALKAELEAVA